jgi:hypothetical protein
MPEQPWETGDATDEIRRLGSAERLRLIHTTHSKEQMAARDLIVGDLLYLLKHGFVYSAGQPSTQNGLYKYAMETRTPNSGNRVVRAILVPDPRSLTVKVITVMWVDE